MAPRKVPQLSAGAGKTPNTIWKMFILVMLSLFLSELDRAGLLNRDVKNVLGLTLPQTLEQYDVMLTQDDAVKNMFRAGPAGIRTTRAFSARLPLGYAGRRSRQWLYPLAGHAYNKRRWPGGALRKFRGKRLRNR